MPKRPTRSTRTGQASTRGPCRREAEGHPNHAPHVQAEGRLITGLHRSPYWMRFIRKMRPIIQQQLPLRCVNAGAHPSCTGVVHPDDKWEVSHLPGLDFSLTGDRYPTAQDVGPAHRACNRAAGGRLGAAKQTRTRARDTRWLPW